ncbi:hypothetical protein [Candidatus Nucleicultrix amoebiphila]|jgi:hypothetical protein|uniref:Uncharacterized protein n=1 Tax=Candidatus Nucleicultrix amoebiphila FS5 TaxID=1414854 RepID=A0A1W6N556_9PROT|nr:hypothetical protein [Candidatus Nucleicultrix amoebiphila]ARN84983.1 hypothetical protein GQ61_06435 [Candidatus Nucleicultrix amoebiphila FS5]
MLTRLLLVIGGILFINTTVYGSTVVQDDLFSAAKKIFAHYDFKEKKVSSAETIKREEEDLAKLGEAYAQAKTEFASYYEPYLEDGTPSLDKGKSIEEYAEDTEQLERLRKKHVVMRSLIKLNQQSAQKAFWYARLFSTLEETYERLFQLSEIKVSASLNYNFHQQLFGDEAPAEGYTLFGLLIQRYNNQYTVLLDYEALMETQGYQIAQVGEPGHKANLTSVDPTSLEPLRALQGKIKSIFGEDLGQAAKALEKDLNDYAYAASVKESKIRSLQRKEKKLLKKYRTEKSESLEDRIDDIQDKIYKRTYEKDVLMTFINYVNAWLSKL